MTLASVEKGSDFYNCSSEEMRLEGRGVVCPGKCHYKEYGGTDLSVGAADYLGLQLTGLD